MLLFVFELRLLLALILMNNYELFERFRSSFIYFLLLLDFDLDLSVLLFRREVLRVLFVGVAAKYSFENASILFILTITKLLDKLQYLS